GLLRTPPALHVAVALSTHAALSESRHIFRCFFARPARKPIHLCRGLDYGGGIQVRSDDGRPAVPMSENLPVGRYRHRHRPPQPVDDPVFQRTRLLSALPGYPRLEHFRRTIRRAVPETTFRLTQQTASHFSRITLGHVTREYPNKL